ncbi:type I polyketide synthase [Streptomyces sp. SID14515]|uniref:type I polyketide synthase n=1 Tax=Streptomyces sp. SID14515 TaxID=2706074 RepID=UPI0031BA8B2D
MDVVQPALWAVMVSLAEVWRSCGVVPGAVVGHSQGEIAAACVAGVLSLEDAARVVALRSGLIGRRLAGSGGMVSVGAGLVEVEGLVGRWPGRLSVAAVNGPGSVVVSGDVAALEELLGVCEAERVRVRRVSVDYASHSSQVEALESELLGLLEGVEARDSVVPFYSTVTGGLVGGAELGGDYWYRNLRERVCFRSAVDAVLEQRFGVFVEVSPHPVLVPGLVEGFDEAGVDAVALGTLRRGEGGWDRVVASVAEAWVHGVEVDWSSLVPAGPRVDLPTYPFQRQRYWLDSAPMVATDVAGAGLNSPDHPFLTAGVELADSDGLVLTGRLSLKSQPWLADHTVMGTTLLPGSAFAELALYAADQVACFQIEELALQAPLALPETGAVDLQVNVSGPDGSGRRSLTIYSKAADSVGSSWTQHADGMLSQEEPPAPGELVVWPPAGADPVSLDGLYTRMTEAGVEFGPAFQGLRQVWRRGDEVYAEVHLADQEPGFGIHPALLDSALHAVGVGQFFPGTAAGRRPFAWTGVSLFATGASTLRVRLALAGEDSISVQLADHTGAPVAAVESLVLRATSSEELRPVAHQDATYHVDWTTVALPQMPTEPPQKIAVIGPVPPDAGLPSYSSPAALAEAMESSGARLPEKVLVTQDVDRVLGAREVRETTERLLSLIRTWLTDERFAESQLVVTTTGAVVTGGMDPVIDLNAAPLWGLLRSAQAENPGRFVLLDVDEHVDSWRALPAALVTGEPQLALRAGVMRVPRLARLQPTAPKEPHAWADPAGNVLVTGGTGGLGALVARHLVLHHGVSRLLLVSRQGPNASGATELRDELAEAGAEVTIVACDVADRDALGRLLHELPDDRPLTAVVHCAGVFDDGLVSSLTSERVDRVYRPKIDAVLNLHDLTAGLEMTAFVLFSSVAGTFGGGGQGNYAAANAFLDAFAHYRRAAGLPATSLVWGLWEERTGMAGRVGEAHLTRASGRGVMPMSAAEGLARLDAGLDTDQAVVLPVQLDLAALRAKAASGTVPALLRGLVRAPARRVVGSGEQAVGLSQRLQGLTEAERRQELHGLVKGQVAAVLGYPDSSAVDPEKPFRELGFDSLTAVELRNRLSAVTGLRLPVTVVFDYPRLDALVRLVHERLFPGARPEPSAPAAGLQPVADRSDEIKTMDADALIQLALGDGGDTAATDLGRG